MNANESNATGFEKQLIAISKALHDPGIDSINNLKINTFPQSGIRYARFRGNDGKVYRLVQQNPARNSRFAALAKQGHSISWLFQEDGMQLSYTNAGIIDDKFIKNMHE